MLGISKINYTYCERWGFGSTTEKNGMYPAEPRGGTPFLLLHNTFLSDID